MAMILYFVAGALTTLVLAALVLVLSRPEGF
jgi:hypothetical protein